MFILAQMRLTGAHADLNEQMIITEASGAGWQKALPGY